VTPIGGSTTRLGALAAGAANTAAFSSVGRLFLDGNGFMFASGTAGGALAHVGTYLVNPDCTISATITDTFAQPGAAGLTPVQVSVTFEGVVGQSAKTSTTARTPSTGSPSTRRAIVPEPSSGPDATASAGTLTTSTRTISARAPDWSAPGAAVVYTGQYDQATPVVSNFGFSVQGDFVSPDNGLTGPLRLSAGIPPIALPTEQDLKPGFGTVAIGQPTKVSVEFFEPDGRATGYLTTFNFNIERQLPGQMLLELGYLSTLGHKLPAPASLTQNPGAAGAAGTGQRSIAASVPTVRRRDRRRRYTDGLRSFSVAAQPAYPRESE